MESATNRSINEDPKRWDTRTATSKSKKPVPASTKAQTNMKRELKEFSKQQETTVLKNGDKWLKMKSNLNFKEDSEKDSDEEETIDEQYMQLFLQFENFMYKLHDKNPPNHKKTEVKVPLRRGGA